MNKIFLTLILSLFLIGTVTASSLKMNISSVTYPNSTVAIANTSYAGSGEFYYNFSNTPAGGAESNTLFFIILIISAVVLLVISFVFKNYIFAFFAGLIFLITGELILRS